MLLCLTLGLLEEEKEIEMGISFLFNGYPEDATRLLVTYHWPCTFICKAGRVVDFKAVWLKILLPHEKKRTDVKG